MSCIVLYLKLIVHLNKISWIYVYMNRERTHCHKCTCNIKSIEHDLSKILVFKVNPNVLDRSQHISLSAHSHSHFSQMNHSFLDLTQIRVFMRQFQRNRIKPWTDLFVQQTPTVRDMDRPRPIIFGVIQPCYLFFVQNWIFVRIRIKA